MRRLCGVRTGSLLFLLLLGWPAAGSAQLRYLITADARERYNSNVFAGATALPDWDFVTELQPGVRFYLNRRSSLLWLQYRFLFQLYSRTQDPVAQRRLLGYANTLVGDYTYLLSARTGLRLANRFEQGTQNTTFRQFGDGGQLLPGILTTGSKFFLNHTQLEAELLLSERWSIRPRLVGDVYVPFDLVSRPGFYPPPTTWSLSPWTTATMSFRNDRLIVDGLFTVLSEKRDYYDRAVPTYLTEATVGWRHYFDDFWATTLTGGIDYRRLGIYLGPGDLGGQNDWTPVGVVELRYRRRREVTILLEYSHRYQASLELFTATTANADTVALYAEWNHATWRIEGGGYFRYLRATLTQADAPPLQATKMGRAYLLGAYFIRDGLSVEAGYDLELSRDQPSLVVIPGLPKPVSPLDYTRHQVTIGISLAWPPPPAQDVRLTRRESEVEPIFPSEAGAPGRATMTDDELVPDSASARRRAAARRRARERPALDIEPPPEPEDPAYPTYDVPEE